MTSIRLKIEESWYASMDCKVQKSGPWVCFYGGHSTGYKLGNHPKNIEPCAHRARTVRQRPLCSHTAHTCFAGKVCGPVRSTWGTSLGGDKLGAGARILYTKVARRADIPPLPAPSLLCASGARWRPMGVGVSRITRCQTPRLLSRRVRSATAVVCGVIVGLDGSDP